MRISERGRAARLDLRRLVVAHRKRDRDAPRVGLAAREDDPRIEDAVPRRFAHRSGQRGEGSIGDAVDRRQIRPGHANRRQAFRLGAERTAGGPGEPSIYGGGEATVDGDQIAIRRPRCRRLRRALAARGPTRPGAPRAEGACSRPGSHDAAPGEVPADRVEPKQAAIQVPSSRHGDDQVIGFGEGKAGATREVLIQLTQVGATIHVGVIDRGNPLTPRRRAGRGARVVSLVHMEAPATVAGETLGIEPVQAR